MKQPTQSFTVEQANRMLPLVRRIVEDVVAAYRRWQEEVGAFEVAAAASGPGTLSALAEASQRRAQELAAELEGLAAELGALGVELKGYDLGLVDFPGELDGRSVYLCWRLGEPSVQYWHERDAGFAGRRPIGSLVA
jgi:hypothetical protein